MGDQELGFEATDEAMSRAFQRWSDVSSYSNPQGWVFRTASNWAISVLRRRKTGRTKEKVVAHSLGLFDQLWLDQRSDVDLVGAVSRLNDDHRMVIVLRFYADKSINQIAQELEIPNGTVKSRLSRALLSLQRDLSQESKPGA